MTRKEGWEREWKPEAVAKRLDEIHHTTHKLSVLI